MKNETIGFITLIGSFIIALSMLFYMRYDQPQNTKHIEVNIQGEYFRGEIVKSDEYRTVYRLEMDGCKFLYIERANNDSVLEHICHHNR